MFFVFFRDKESAQSWSRIRCRLNPNRGPVQVCAQLGRHAEGTAQAEKATGLLLGRLGMPMAAIDALIENMETEVQPEQEAVMQVSQRPAVCPSPAQRSVGESAPKLQPVVQRCCLTTF